MQRRALRGKANLAPQLVDQEQRRDLADPGLDRHQRDQVAIELVEHLEDVGRGERGTQICPIAHRNHDVGLSLVDVILLGLGGLRKLALRPHPELERHAYSLAPFVAAVPLDAPTASW